MKIFSFGPPYYLRTYFNKDIPLGFHCLFTKVFFFTGSLNNTESRVNYLLFLTTNPIRTGTHSGTSWMITTSSSPVHAEPGYSGNLGKCLNG